MKLTAAGKAAIQALLDLHQHRELGSDKPVTLKEIAERQAISLYFLEQIFRRLRISGIVKSVRGPGGGYVLARQASELSLKDILNGVGETTSLLGETSADSSGSPQEKAVLRVLSEVDAAMGTLLESFTLDELQDELDARD